MEYRHLPQLPDVELSLGKFKHFSFAPHVHLDFHIGVVTRGAQRFAHKGEQLLLTPGSLATMNPDMVHTGQSADASDYVTRVLSVPVTLVEELANNHGHSEWFFGSGLLQDAQVFKDFVQLHQQLSLPGTATLDGESALLGFVDTLMQQHGERCSQPKEYRLCSDALGRIHELFHHAPGDDYNLQTLADLVGLGKYQLLRQFKQATGMPPFAYLQRIRLEYAKKALHNGQRLCDLACSLGFFDEAHLNKAFKQAYTLSPSAYRQTLAS